MGQSGSTIEIATALDSVVTPVVLDAVQEDGAAYPILVESRQSGGE